MSQVSACTARCGKDTWLRTPHRMCIHMSTTWWFNVVRHAMQVRCACNLAGTSIKPVRNVVIYKYAATCADAWRLNMRINTTESKRRTRSHIFSVEQRSLLPKTCTLWFLRVQNFGTYKRFKKKNNSSLHNEGKTSFYALYMRMRKTFKLITHLWKLCVPICT